MCVCACTTVPMYICTILALWIYLTYSEMISYSSSWLQVGIYIYCMLQCTRHSHRLRLDLDRRVMTFANIASLCRFIQQHSDHDGGLWQHQCSKTLHDIGTPPAHTYVGIQTFQYYTVWVWVWLSTRSIDTKRFILCIRTIQQCIAML